jgi:riboflavin kinase
MIMPEDLQCLKVLALMGGLNGPVRVSSQSLGTALRTSPQTASRRLQALERRMLLARAVGTDGQSITITRGGKEELRREFSDYCRLFSKESESCSLFGSVISGLGEGKYYMSLDHYVEQFSRVLGFVPFPGTLNIRLHPSSLSIRKQLDQRDWISIDGFTADERSFGNARCLPCRLHETPCGIVIPGRSHYPDDVLEVIAPVSLRETYRLADSDTIAVEVAP